MFHEGNLIIFHSAIYASFWRLWEFATNHLCITEIFFVELKNEMLNFSYKIFIESKTIHGKLTIFCQLYFSVLWYAILNQFLISIIYLFIITLTDSVMMTFI